MSIRGLRLPARVMVNNARMMSSSPIGAVPQALYKNVWRKSNIMYITYIVAGCVAIEAVYGGITNAVWDGYNRGVRNKNIFCFVAVNRTHLFYI
jgi:hypothetical protein